MNKSVFQNRAQYPDDENLRSELGENYGMWRAVIEFAGANIPEQNSEWKFVDRLSGWLLVVKSGSRIILYLCPLTEGISTVFLIDKKSYEKAMVAGFSDEIVAAIRDSEPHFDGRIYMLPLRGEDELAVMRTLTEIKLSD